MSTIVQPDPTLATYPPAAIAQLNLAIAAAKADITALESGGAASDFKASVLLATTAVIANLSSITVANFQAQGVTLTAGKRVLVQNNASPDGVIAQHGKYQGIYVVGTVAAGSAPLTRATDFDEDAEVTSGTLIPVEAGTHAGKVRILKTANPITVGTTALSFDAFTDIAAAQTDATAALAAAAAAQSTANAAVPKASVQQARGVMVAGSVTFAAFTLTAGSIVVPMKEIEDPAASGALTVGAVTPGAPGSVTITSANGAETSTIRALVLG